MLWRARRGQFHRNALGFNQIHWCISHSPAKIPLFWLAKGRGNEKWHEQGLNRSVEESYTTE